MYSFLNIILLFTVTTNNNAMYSKNRNGNRNVHSKLPIVVLQINSFSSIESEEFRETWNRYWSLFDDTKVGSIYCWKTGVFSVERFFFEEWQVCWNLISWLLKLHLSFPIIHKVRNIDISVQLLREIIWKQLKNQSISMQINIYHGALNSYRSDWSLYFQKQVIRGVPTLPTLCIMGKLDCTNPYTPHAYMCT